MARFFRRKATLLATGVLALSLLGGGIAVAAPSDGEAGVSGGQSQPPVSKEDVARAEAAIAAAGTDALPPTAQVFSAVVSANGNLVRGVEAISARRLARGQYEVVFSSDVRAAAFVATHGLTGSLGIAPSGEIAVVGRTGLRNGVFVQTWNSAGRRADRSFHLLAAS